MCRIKGERIERFRAKKEEVDRSPIRNGVKREREYEERAENRETESSVVTRSDYRCSAPNSEHLAKLHLFSSENRSKLFTCVQSPWPCNSIQFDKS
jgi:hypothetical protein